MDWQTLLKSQQTEFIKRLKSGRENLLFCQLENQFSELRTVSGEKLKQLRDSAWQMVEKQKATDSIRVEFLNDLTAQLGEDIVRHQLNNLLVKGSPKRLMNKDSKKNFNARQWKIFITYIRAYQYLSQFMPVELFPIGCLRLAANPSISIQVKAGHGTVETIQWKVSREEVKKNVALVCVLILEELSEAQTEYHLVMAGFLPTYLIKLKDNNTSLNIRDLFYSGGLRSFLDALKVEPAPTNATKSTKPSSDLLNDRSSTISIGAWNYPLSLEQLLNLETAIQQLLDQHQTAQTELKPLPIFFKPNSKLDPMWNEVLNHVRPLSTQSLLRQQSCLLSFDGDRAQVGISSEALFAINPKWLLTVEEAFVKLLKREIEVSVEVISG